MTRNDPFRTKFHRDDTITVWDVYSQSWTRLDASQVPDEILASLSAGERRRIARMVAKEAK